MEHDSLLTVFELQKKAEKTTNIFELEKLRDSIPLAAGTMDQKFVLRQFIIGKIKDPHRRSATQ